MISSLAVPRRHFCFLSSWLFFFPYFSRLMTLLLCLFVFYVILALRPPALQCQLPALLFVCVSFVLFLIAVVLSGEPKQYQGRGLVDRKLVQAPSIILLLAVLRRPFCFCSLVVLDVVFRYLSLFLLYINIKIR